MVLNTPLSYKLSTYHYSTDVCKDPSDYRNSRPKVLCKKCVLRNFEKLTGKHLCQGFFFNKAPDWLSCFKVLHYCYFLLGRQKPPGVQWRNREKRDDKEHHEKASFFSST